MGLPSPREGKEPEHEGETSYASLLCAGGKRTAAVTVAPPRLPVSTYLPLDHEGYRADLRIGGLQGGNPDVHLRLERFLFANTFAFYTSTKPVTVVIPSFAGIFTINYGAQAAAIVVTIPLVVLVLILQRRIVSGLTAGAIKG